jgi:hypothetical protein
MPPGGMASLLFLCDPMMTTVMEDDDEHIKNLENCFPLDHISGCPHHNRNLVRYLFTRECKFY